MMPAEISSMMTVQPQTTPGAMMRPEFNQPEGVAPAGAFGAEKLHRRGEVTPSENVTIGEDPVMRMFDRSGLRQGYERYLETNDRAAWCDRIGDTAGASQARSEGHMQLLAVQMGVQENSMKIELASMVVEHGSSSTRTILQTQM